MEDNDNWIESKDANFKIDQFYKLNKEFRKLEIEHMLIAIAQNGGPIAITSDKRKILALRADDPSLENVCIFSNEGELTCKAKIDNAFRQVIVAFDFLIKEMLLVLFSNGIYWVLDPYRGTYKKYDIKSSLKEGEEIIEGKVFENGFAFTTNNFRFLFVRNVQEAYCIEFRDSQLKAAPSHWVVLPPKQIISERVEIHMTHPTAGIIQLVQDEGRRVFYNKKSNEHMIESQLPEIKYIRFISSMSANGRVVAYFSVEPIFAQLTQQQLQQLQQRGEQRVPESWVYRLVFTSTDFQNTVYKVVDLKKLDEAKLLDKQKRPKAMVWCGDDAVIIQYQNNTLFMVFLQTGDIDRIDRDRPKGDEFTFLRQESDGVRIQTKERNKILRKIPTAYVNIFEPLSQKPGALLYHAYTAFEQKQPLQDDEIRNKKADLAVAVMDCINASKFESKADVAIQLMKAASYGKSFLQPNQIPNNVIQEVCKNLRVLNQLREQKRVLTYAQFEALSEEGLLIILLRYNMHYLAYEIYNYLKKSQKFRVQIYTHWACCRVESEDEEETVCRDIRNKLSNEKGVSFTEIAHKAIDLGKTDLALRLLEYEPSLAKKVPLLLWMGTTESSKSMKFFSKALQEAELSKDPNLLCLVIQRIRASERLTEFEIFELFSSTVEARSALISYYRIFDYATLIRYYEYTKDREMSGIFTLHFSFKTQKYVDQLKLMEAALESFKLEPKDVNQWRRETLNQYVDHYSMFVKEYPKIIYKNERGNYNLSIDNKSAINAKPGTINQMLEGFMAKNNVDGADDVKKTYNIPDKRIVLTKIKILINQGKWEELENFVEKNQKKFKLPVEMIADLLMKKRQESWAMRMIAKMPEKEKEEQYALLQRIDKIHEAITLAADRKDREVLEDIKSTLLDPKELQYLNERLYALSKK